MRKGFADLLSVDDVMADLVARTQPQAELEHVLRDICETFPFIHIFTEKKHAYPERKIAVPRDLRYFTIVPSHFVRSLRLRQFNLDFCFFQVVFTIK